MSEPTISAEEFERGYAERSGLTVEQFREYQTVRRCFCDETKCKGWMAITHTFLARCEADPVAAFLHGLTPQPPIPHESEPHGSEGDTV